VYYIDYFLLLNENVFFDNYEQGNRDNSNRKLTRYFRESIKWPYDMIHSCYWAVMLTYDDYYAKDFPNVINLRDEDGNWVMYDKYG
jgi:hypothetical protein